MAFTRLDGSHNARLLVVWSTIPRLFLLLLSIMSAAAAAQASFYRRAPLRIKRLSDQATLPQAGSDLAAGIDLAAAKALIIKSGARALVPTDLSIACPPGTYGRIAPRSGLAYKKGIDVGGELL